MFTPEVAKAISLEERIKAAQGLVSEKTEKILDQNILIAVAKQKKRVSIILDNKNAGDSEENIESYLILLGYSRVRFTSETLYHFDDSYTTTTLRFSIP